MYVCVRQRICGSLMIKYIMVSYNWDTRMNYVANTKDEFNTGSLLFQFYLTFKNVFCNKIF